MTVAGRAAASMNGGSIADLDVALERIDRYDATIGAFVEVLRERAMDHARAADAATAAGSASGSLHGVPIAIKELFDVEGADGSYGSVVLEGRRAKRDAAVVTALRNAGAVVVGTTRSHEFGWGITTQHATRGSTRNPWDLGRVPGGSSGGSAAAVAAGLVPLAVGSDTGGSIRLPAAFCGVLGLKTTYGRISRVGGAALAPSFDSPGFLARSVSLLAAAFSACAGLDPEDPSTAPSPPADPVVLDRSTSSLRFALPDGLTPEPLEPARELALAAMSAGLRALGLNEVEVSLPDARSMLGAFAPLQMAEALDVHTNGFRTYPSQADAYGADVRARLELARAVTIAQYLEARRGQDTTKTAFARAFQVADVLVSPVGATGPSGIDTPDVVSMSGSDVPLRLAMMPYTIPQNLAGLPSITCPVGVDEAGLPIGIQLTGAPWNEPMLLSLAFALEREGVVRVSTAPMFSDRAHTPEGPT